MDSSVEETELDVESINDELESVEAKMRSIPKPFTIESLIGNKGQAVGIEREYMKRNDKLRVNVQNSDQEQEFLYQQHCLATATSSLPGL